MSDTSTTIEFQIPDLIPIGSQFYRIKVADLPDIGDSETCVYHSRPDGKTVLFARAKAHELKDLKDRSKVLVKREEAREFFEGGRMSFSFDGTELYFRSDSSGNGDLYVATREKLGGPE